LRGKFFPLLFFIIPNQSGVRMNLSSLWCLPHPHFCKATLILLSGTMLGLFGCSREKLEEMAASVQEQAKSVQEQATAVQEQARALTESSPMSSIVASSGRTTIGLPAPIEASSGFVRLYVIGDGRPSVVQFTSYDPAEGPNVFPALLLRAETDATSSQMLDGKTVQATVFLQTTSDGPILTTSESASVPLAISVADGASPMLVGRASSITLVDTAGNASMAGEIVVEGKLP